MCSADPVPPPHQPWPASMLTAVTYHIQISEASWARLSQMHEPAARKVAISESAFIEVSRRQKNMQKRSDTDRPEHHHRVYA